jgi:tetratricopeptide (TPR) repeat protein
VPVGLNAPLPEIAVGTNVSVTDFLSVQGGVLLRAGNPRISLGTNLDLPIVSLTVNYNLDLSARLAAPGDLFSAQARFNLGDRGRGALAAQVEQLYNSGLAQYVAGNYSQAIEQWKRVLELDADYTPARNYLRIVQESLDSAETLAPKVTE